MDNLYAIASKWNLEVLKEPKGFIKLLQFVLAIFAFATTTSVNTSVGLTVNCVNGTSPMVLSFPISYPFNTKATESYDLKACTGGVVGSVRPCCDYSGKSEFYVAIGVLVWLYVIAALVVYVAFDEVVYARYEHVPTIDFMISCIITMAWLVASSVWADGLRRMKIFSSGHEMATVGVLSPYCSVNSGACHDYVTGVYNVLNVSIIFGFLNCSVWGASLWFLYKDTHWFKNAEDLPNFPVTSNPTGTDPVIPTSSDREYSGY